MYDQSILFFFFTLLLNFFNLWTFGEKTRQLRKSLGLSLQTSGNAPSPNWSFNPRNQTNGPVSGQGSTLLSGHRKSFPWKPKGILILWHTHSDLTVVRTMISLKRNPLQSWQWPTPTSQKLKNKQTNITKLSFTLSFSLSAVKLLQSLPPNSHTQTHTLSVFPSVFKILNN